MRKTHIIALSIIAIALLAAAIALWPSGAQAGPTAQTTLDPSTAAPTITDLTFAGTPRDDAYAAGETIRITVKFSETVKVTGTPQINLDVGAHKRKADYFRGTNSNKLKFSYTVLAQDYDNDGVSVPAGTILTDAATILGEDDTAAKLTHRAIDPDDDRKVQGAPDRTPYFESGASIAPVIYPRNKAITSWILPTALGGNGVRTYSLSPAPPAGLVFNADTHTLSGTPTKTLNTTNYTYSVVDEDGDANSLPFTIKIDGEPTFGSDTPARTFAKGAVIANWTLPAAEHGNTPVTYAISPAPPDGLVFDLTTRTFSGTPTKTDNAVTFTLTATDADGDIGDHGTMTFTITIDGEPAFASDSDTLPAQTFTKDAAITTWIMPAATDGNTPLTYSLSPAPPAGLAFDAATRTLSGTPTATQNAGDFTYAVTDADGDKDELTFTITVDSTPTFGEQTVAAETYVRNVAIDALQLPQASDGNTPLTYSLTTPPAGLTFNAASRTLSGTPTAQQTATAYTYTVTDADGDAVSLTFNITVIVDYDADDDQLIEVDSLAKLNAIRWDLDGNGVVDTRTSDANTAKYNAAYSDAPAGMGCKLVDHDDNAATAQTPVCIGYELVKDLDFDTDDDGATYTVSSTGVVTGDAGDAYYNGGKGWTPIALGDADRNTTFDGNGNTISNLFIKDTGGVGVGLFAGIVGVRVERLGLRNLNVTGQEWVGGLAGFSFGGKISDSYATGSVTGSSTYSHGVGGLVGYTLGGTISGSYATGSVTGYNGVGGLVGANAGYGGSYGGVGSITNSYATGSVSGSNIFVGGLVGENAGPINASYATGSVTGTGTVGGLVGQNGGSSINASYATGSVSNSGGHTGGLAGTNGGDINASYATGSVTGNSYAVGGLVGLNGGDINASYAAGLVKGTGNNVGGLVGIQSILLREDTGTVTNSYWDNGTTGQATSAGGTGKTTRELQRPIGYTGIYASWNANVDGVAGGDVPWDFGTPRQYPVLKYGSLDPVQQHPPLSVHHDNWDAPVAGEPVTAVLTKPGVTGITWQWQSSADAATWTNITSATSDTYIPVAADAASGGKHLRVTATFTASGSSQTLTAEQTAKVVSAPGATAADATSGIPIVGLTIRHRLSATGSTNPYVWRWQRCDDAAMTTNCKFRSSSEPADNAYTEYTPVAGTDTDVGKYLQAYVYYIDTANSNAWTRTQTPVLGPVVAAAPAPTTTP